MPRDLLVRYPRERAGSRIRIGFGALDELGSLTRAETGARRAALVTDSRVGSLYGSRAAAALRAAGIESFEIRVPRGESAKAPRHLARLWERLAETGLGRRDVLVALGGGVVGDLAGFAAATWLRGIPWVCAPTTLVAQVDSSVGGKVAVNLRAGKNLAGAFHQPAAVVADPGTLATLPRRQLAAGLAEVVKVGFATDARLFRWIESAAAELRRADSRALERAVTEAVRAKARVVRRDEREREAGPRTALNFGHTLGHALEAATGYGVLLHGEAVALGMRAAARLSERLAGLPRADRGRLEALLDGFGLPRHMPDVPPQALLDALAQDKKRGAREVRWVLTPQVGHASVPRPIAPRWVRTIVVQLGARA